MSSNKQFCIAIRHVCTSCKLPLQAKNSQLCCRTVAAARELFADVQQLVAHGAAESAEIAAASCRASLKLLPQQRFLACVTKR